jgi:hypothetical protein
MGGHCPISWSSRRSLTCVTARQTTTGVRAIWWQTISLTVALAALLLPDVLDLGAYTVWSLPVFIVGLVGRNDDTMMRMKMI